MPAPFSYWMSGQSREAIRKWSVFIRKTEHSWAAVVLFNLGRRNSGVLEWFRTLYRITRQFFPVFSTMLSAAAAERNKEPILAVLRQSVNTERPLQALEVSSGTGQHVTHFAQALRYIIWQPSEYDHQSLAR